MLSKKSWDSEVREALEFMHPGNWDQEPMTEDDILEDRNYTFYVKYPRFIIQNSKGLSHIIRDFYLRLVFRDDGRLSTVNGSRGILTQAEKQSGYAHSHLSSTSTRGKFGSFCFGQGPIQNTTDRLCAEFDAATFEMLLHGFQTYLEWESIEGRPFKWIENIRRASGLSNVYIDELEDIYNKFVNKYDNIKFLIQTSPAKLKIDPLDIDFIAMVEPLVREEHLVFRNITTQEFYAQGSNIYYDNIDMEFIFKGEAIYQKVINDNEEQESETYPHPDILRYISERLERKLTIYAFNEGTRCRREPQGDYIGGIMVQAV